MTLYVNLLTEKSMLKYSRSVFLKLWYMHPWRQMSRGMQEERMRKHNKEKGKYKWGKRRKKKN